MRVKVWNDNRFPHAEKFRGEVLRIEPGQFVEMDYMDAVQFKGQMSGIKRDVDGAQAPESFKMIRIEEIKGGSSQAVSKPAENFDLICQFCNYKGTDALDIAKHILEKHSDSLADKSRDEAGKRLTEAITKRR